MNLLNPYRFSSGGFSPDSFIITVKTDNSGVSASNQFTIPLQGAFTYDFTVKTSDGQDLPTNTRTITFPSAGTYDIAISGIFPTIYAGVSGTDSLKIIGVKQWGNIEWTTLSISFRNCTNLVSVSAPDTPNLSNATVISGCFRGCTNLPSISNINNWDVSNITNVSQFLFVANNLDANLSNWTIHQIRDFTNFATNINMSTSNYDDTLVGWEANLQSVYPNGVGYPSGSYSVNFRGVTYTSGGAGETARTSMINNFGWTFTDGGGV